jgi:hypothetical protein
MQLCEFHNATKIEVGITGTEIRWTHIFYLYSYHPTTDPDDQ